MNTLWNTARTPWMIPASFTVSSISEMTRRRDEDKATDSVDCAPVEIVVGTGVAGPELELEAFGMSLYATLLLLLKEAEGPGETGKGNSGFIGLGGEDLLTGTGTNSAWIESGNAVSPPPKAIFSPAGCAHSVSKGIVARSEKYPCSVVHTCAVKIGAAHSASSMIPSTGTAKKDTLTIRFGRLFDQKSWRRVSKLAWSWFSSADASSAREGVEDDVVLFEERRE